MFSLNLDHWKTKNILSLLNIIHLIAYIEHTKLIRRQACTFLIPSYLNIIVFLIFLYSNYIRCFLLCYYNNQQISFIFNLWFFLIITRCLCSLLNFLLISGNLIVLFTKLMTTAQLLPSEWMNERLCICFCLWNIPCFFVLLNGTSEFLR